ncbi:MAG TPA: GNAT family N-acetyltransferase [Methyloceanibacter sp.]|nr:GNAT family N-acetyltransferase [Methyloceanibacter sp.]
MGDIAQRQQGAEDGAIVRVVSRIAAVPASEWDACAVGADSSETRARPGNPFLSHSFLHALEESGSATRQTGWLPQHLVLEDAAGGTAACMPCYLKSHSYGEYVFDHAWADAYERAGGGYYPKLLAAVPFTPVTGPRLLVRDGPNRTEREALLLQAGATLTERLDASSLHITFPTREEWELAGKLGFLQRNDQQFHWRNEGYGSFEDFLAALASRKRKSIRSERSRAVEGGIEIQWVTGADLTEAHWDAFFAFYVDTGSRKWGSPYLTRTFFSLISETMRDEILLVLARREGRAIAGALNFIGADALYGRYWGAVEEHPCLHFEVCYYQAIDFAIQHKLARVEAGAQGAHKLARGYLPVPTYSAHWIRDPALRRAVADYLKRERAAVGREIAMLGEESPYRKAE